MSRNTMFILAVLAGFCLLVLLVGCTSTTQFIIKQQIPQHHIEYEVSKTWKR